VTRFHLPVNNFTNGIPDFGNQLPFVDKKRRGILGNHQRVSLNYQSLALTAQTAYRLAPLESGRCLAHAFGPIENYRWQQGEEFVEFVVNNAALVFTTKSCTLDHDLRLAVFDLYSSISRPYTLPFLDIKLFHF